MRVRIWAMLLVLAMTVALCGCEVDLDVSPVGQQNGQVTVTTGNAAKPSSDAWDGGAKKTTVSGSATTATDAYATLPVLQRNPKYDNEFGAYHALLAYTFTDVNTVNRWLPSVGYIKDGEIKGVMYDSIILLPSPYNVYYSGMLSNKANWDSFREHCYANLDTLNEAVRQVQEALNLKDYKVKVFLSLWEPSATNHANWGTFNGRSYSAKNEGQCFDMVKYMVDSYNTEMAKRNYSNLDFAGFYWFEEAFDTEKGAWYRQVTDYVHSTGKLIVHAPYYKSGGYTYGHLYGMDLVAMQSNYFHNNAIGQATTGSIKRLAANAKIVQAGTTDGMTIEASSIDDHDDMTTFKNTMKTVLEHGIEDGYFIYYFGSGATAPYTMCHSDNAYIRSGYDEFYRFINQTLTVDSMNIEEYDKPQEVLDGATEFL